MIFQTSHLVGYVDVEARLLPASFIFGCLFFDISFTKEIHVVSLHRDHLLNGMLPTFFKPWKISSPKREDDKLYQWEFKSSITQFDMSSEYRILKRWSGDLLLLVFLVDILPNTSGFLTRKPETGIFKNPKKWKRNTQRNSSKKGERSIENWRKKFARTMWDGSPSPECQWRVKASEG